MGLDLQLFYTINGNHNLILDYLFLFFTTIQELAAVWFLFVILSLMYNKKDGKKIGLMFLLGIILHLIIVDLIIKQLYFRPRPFTILENVHRLGKVWTNSSFPAGHASAAFLGAVIFSKFYRKFTIPLFIMAVITAVSRIYLGVHYPSDVLAGAVIGLLIGVLVLWMEKKGLFDKILKQ